MMRNYFLKIYKKARQANSDKILDLLEADQNALLLDLGCDDGVWTSKLAKKIGTKNVFGLEIVESRRLEAQKRGISTASADLNGKLPYENDFFDVVHANQVIEHLHDTDNFVEEIHRILKPGGYAVISTENLSSWHNIFALILGFQPFSMANFSKKGTIGNPFSLWKNEQSKNSGITHWQHNRLFSYYGLKDLFKKYGFNVKKIQTSGYHPFPVCLSNIDSVHGHYIVYKIKK